MKKYKGIIFDLDCVIENGYYKELLKEMSKKDF